MRELRVAALSEVGDHLVLVGAGGGAETFRLPVDERLRAALAGRLGRVGQQEIRLESALSPRQIQARLRAGEAAEQVARLAGVPVERVTRYEGPVLAERARVAEQVRAATLSVTGGEWTGVPLGAIVASYLEQTGQHPRDAEWDAWRRDDGRWVVEVRFGSESRAGSARWLWDPGLARLTGLDEGATRVLGPVRAQRADRAGQEAVPLPRPLHAVPSDAAERPEPAGGPVGADAPPAPTTNPAPGPGRAAGGESPGHRAPGGDAAARRGRRNGVPAWADVLLGPSGG